MADALALIGEEKPEFVVDIATLTGACSNALGSAFSGLYSNDEDVRDLLMHAAHDSGDLLWPMPIHEHHVRQLGHPKADLRNVGVQEGASSSAAAFLREFCEFSWAHIDMAGKGHVGEGLHDYVGAGATGWGCRLLMQLGQRLSHAEA